jgi:hypothetical protein
MTRLLNLAGILCLFVSLAAFAQVPVPPISGDSSADEPEADRPYSALRYDSTSGTGFVTSSYLSSRVGASYLYDSDIGDSAFMPTGTLTLVKRSRRNDTEIDYTGGGSIHSVESAYDSQFQRLALSETFHGASWRMTLADQFEYLPESGYGNSAFGGIPPQLIAIFQSLFPDQSFIQPGTQEIMNGAIVNGEKLISRKLSVHGGFVHSLMQYPESGLVGLQSYQGSGGLTRQIGRRDSIAVDYTGSLTDFSGSYSMVSNKLALTYTHPFRNRARLELSVGPEAVLLRSPNQSNVNRMLVDGSASFSWQTRKIDASLSYAHNAGSGGGLLQGAEVHSVTASASRRLLRVWTLGLQDGFRNVDQLSSLLSTGTALSYRNAYTGFSMQRNIGRTMTFNVNYNFQYQIENQLALPETQFRRNQVMAGFTYNLRPISLE